MLRLTPGALTSQRLEQRPAGLPTHLFIHGGLGPTRSDAVVFHRSGPVRIPDAGLDQLARLRRSGTPLWLRLQGLADRMVLHRLLDGLEVPAVLHAPLLEVPQRPQVKGLEEVLLVILHRLSFARDPSYLVSEQVALVLLPGLLITVEEGGSGDPFPTLTEWLLSQSGSLEDRDLDDILHFLIDDLLDGLFPMLEAISLKLDALEESSLRNPRPLILRRSYEFRSNLRIIRTLIWPLRHQIRLLLRQRQWLLGPEALEGFRDMAELVDQLFEACGSLRSQCDAITHSYAATIGNRMNQVMKTLTILTSIFAPLTFIAGIYGMNFEYMPELRWHHGYALVMLFMAAVAAAQAWWLWHRGWFQDWTGQR
ncbi:CorA family divalent cation transporter [Synechococcus sp. CCY 9618]|uniref:CorA family divalent cation transporter n=1 Tax=Synechococcus sp. CCY 9618 TaxID=2815602 RepID=UPI0020B28CD6|nr:CorA family divalent cation transporter [Synechococcus sp. CCY 9618]